MLSVLVIACGVTLSEGGQETELFKKLTIKGDFVPSGELVVGLDYAQPYTVGLDVQCDLLTLAKPTPTPEPTVDPDGGERGEPEPTLVRIPASEPTPANRLSVIFLSAIGPNVEGSTADEATPVLGSLSGTFHLPEKPGRYAVRCYTPGDDNNAISESFRIEPATAPD